MSNIGLVLICVACFAAGAGARKIARLRPRRSVPVHQRRQEGAAMHEAAHAIADAVEFGPGSVLELCVRSEMRKGDDCYGYMRTADIQETTQITLAHVRKKVASALAGRAADDIFLGAPHVGSVEDLEMANEMLLAAYGKCCFGDTLVQYPNDYFDAPDAMRKWMDDELRNGYARAKAIIRANEAAVNALAKEVLGRTPILGERKLNADDLAEFFRGHPLAALEAGS